MNSGSPPRAWGIRKAPPARSAARGSPPRAWGILPPPAVVQCFLRFTPTCVGNTARRFLEALCHSVHPHVRGEYGAPLPTGGSRDRFTPTCVGNTATTLQGTVRVGGSPPRAWGIRSGSNLSAQGNGSPPRAWGILVVFVFFLIVSPVHPHVRGEYAGHRRRLKADHRFTPTCVGNTVAGLAAEWIQPRFTPTCVGNTEPTRVYRCHDVGSPPRAWGILKGGAVVPRLPAVHPHVRGEYDRALEGLSVARPVHPHVRGEYDCSGWISSRLAVHPHVRGEYVDSHDNHSDVSGSPPRAWGIRLTCGPIPRVLRFTPTCVGNTYILRICSTVKSGSPPRAWGIRRRPRAAPQSCSVHPHVRGEYTICFCSGVSWYGSPPRAWGIPCGSALANPEPRFTPTCVGNTTPARVRCVGFRGSPPRAWGIRPRHYAAADDVRFTPTCVGNTSPSTPTCGQAAVHPHVRGEYGATSAAARGGLGSPPRAWGIRDADPDGRAVYGSPPRAWGILGAGGSNGTDNRFTPTCVGNTLTLGRQPVHPLRFTPTCVGNTVHAAQSGREAAVHPHVRGEYGPQAKPHRDLGGSPPRAWGIRTGRRLHTGWNRFTPTCVGNTQRPDARADVRGGSPPRAWGILRAGLPTRRRRLVHPHVRGEYAEFYAAVSVFASKSPSKSPMHRSVSPVTRTANPCSLFVVYTRMAPCFRTVLRGLAV